MRIILQSTPYEEQNLNLMNNLELMKLASLGLKPTKAT